MNSEELQRRLADDDPRERQRVIEEFLEYARETREVEDYMTLAMSLVSVEMFHEAAEILRWTVRSVGDHPQNAIYRLSLASVFEDLEWYACSRCLRDYVARTAPTAEDRSIAKAELARLDVLLASRTSGVHDLERIRSESKGLAQIAESVRSGGALEFDARAERSVGNLNDFLRSDEELGPDRDDLRSAIVDDLGALARRYPDSIECALPYAWGLLVTNRHDELKSHLAAMRRLEVADHTFHYNYGQLLLLGAGDIDGARRHLALSLQLAKTPEDISDAKEVIDRFRGLIGDIPA